MDRSVFQKMTRPMRTIVTAVTAVALVWVSACTTFGKSETTQQSTEAAVLKTEFPGALVLLPNCPIRRVEGEVEFVPLVGLALGWVVSAVAPVAIHAVVGAVAGFLEERAKELNSSTTASDRVVLWRHDQGKSNYSLWARCLVFVRGEFGSGDASAKHAFSTVSNKAIWESASTDLVNAAFKDAGRENIRLRGAPEIYVELPITYGGKIEVSDIETKDSQGRIIKKETLRIPRTIEIGPPFLVYLTPGPKRGDQSKKLVLNISVSADMMSDGKRQESTILDRPIDFGMVSKMSRVERNQFVSSPPLKTSLPYPFQEKVDVVQNNKLVTYTAINGVTISFTGILTESEDGGDVERGVAKAIRDNEDKLKDPVLKFLDDLIKKATTDSATPAKK
jgi:hypothetical protein